MNNTKNIFILLLVLGIGLGAGYWLAENQGLDDSSIRVSHKAEPLFYRNPMNPAITSPVPAKDSMGMDYIPVYAEDKSPDERKPLFYRNPMNPEITSPVPAQDPMGMDYIPVYADEGGTGKEASGTVKIDPVTVQNIGVRTAVAEQRDISRSIRAVGRVTFDEERLARLHPKIEGWIEEMFIDKTGEPVNAGTMLLGIYSPELVASQQEYLLALNNREILKDSPFEDIRKGAETLVSSSRERLQLMDVPAHQLQELEEKRAIKKILHIHSPFKGIVMKTGVREGQYVTPRTELYMLADLTKVWVDVDVYEYELPWINEGDLAKMQVAAVPGKIFKGKVGYIYPYMESKTRTVKVRIEFDNPKMELKLDMFVNVDIQAGKQIKAIVVPSEAIIRSGSREQVFIVRGQGKFEPREVKLGFSTHGETQILEGVAAGERVVTSAQFLIDSESKLREATAKMMEVMQQEKLSSNQASDMELDDMNMPDMSMDDMDMSGMDKLGK